VRGVLRSAVYLVQWTGMMKICFGMAMNKMGMLEVIGKEMKAQTVKMETVTLIGKGTENFILSG